MTTFVKGNTSLEEVGRSKVRNYTTLDAVKAAIRSGELKAGDLFTTICNVESICDDLAFEIYRILSYIPEDTNSDDNTLVNQSMLEGGVNQKIEELAEEVSNKVYCDCFQDFQTLAGDALGCKVNCSDYNTYTSSNDTRVSNIESCTGLSCTGNVKSVTLGSSTCYPDANGNVNITGTTAATYQLSGTTLYINF